MTRRPFCNGILICIHQVCLRILSRMRLLQYFRVSTPANYTPDVVIANGINRDSAIALQKCLPTRAAVAGGSS